jgi:peptidoglycan/xylan/chitin deacetylase (PgdA/CDA1 family)
MATSDGLVEPTPWPDGVQCAVVLSFDLDAESGSLYRDPTNADRPVLISHGRYGPRRAVPNLLTLLAEQGLPATFFIPAWVAEQYPAAVEAIVAAGHEVGAHGDLHERLDQLSGPDEEEAILVRSIEVLTARAGRRPVGYRSPSWEFSPATLTLLHRHGFLYSSNMMDDYHPYLHPTSPGAAPLVELPIQWLLDDAPLFWFRPDLPTRPIQPNGNALAIWSEEFTAIHRRRGLFVLTMHPQIIGRPSRIDMLARLIDHINCHPGVWFATGEAVADHLRARLAPGG